MTGTQLLVLALLGGAFACGWLARGATRDDSGTEPAGALLEEAVAALDTAFAALRAVVAVHNLDDPMGGELRRDTREHLARHVAALSPLEHRLDAALGEGHPSTGDFRRARETLELLADEAAHGDADRMVFEALAEGAADARRRFALGARAVAGLPR